MNLAKRETGPADTNEWSRGETLPPREKREPREKKAGAAPVEPDADGFTAAGGAGKERQKVAAVAAKEEKATVSKFAGLAIEGDSDDEQ
jgi:hypothetical protein